MMDAITGMMLPIKTDIYTLGTVADCGRFSVFREDQSQKV